MSESRHIYRLIVLVEAQDHDAMTQYQKWLNNKHIPDLLRTYAVRVAVVENDLVNTSKLMVQVDFESVERYQTYVDGPAIALRKEITDLLGDKLQIQRFSGYVTTIADAVYADKNAQYNLVADQLKSICTPDLPWQSRLATLIALLKEHFPGFSWIGFYRDDGQKLVVDSYQGKLACTTIAYDRGVCGKAFRTNELQLVQDVLSFDGHIACDSLSRSEIVLPLFKDGKIVGVFDIDSYIPGHFTDVDAKHLAYLLTLLDD